MTNILDALPLVSVFPRIALSTFQPLELNLPLYREMRPESYVRFTSYIRVCLYVHVGCRAL